MNSGSVGKYGGMPGWSSPIFLRKYRARYPKLMGKPYHINAFGVNILNLGNLAHTSSNPARATVNLKDGRIVRFLIDRVEFMVKPNDRGYVLGFPYRKVPFIQLEHQKPVIIGAKSPDTAEMRGFFPGNFPPFACAVTLRDGTDLLIEDLDNSHQRMMQVFYGLSLSSQAYSRRHVNEMIEMNRKFLHWAVTSKSCFKFLQRVQNLADKGPSYYKLPGNFIVRMSPEGRLLTCNELTEAEHFTFWVMLNADLTMHYDPHNKEMEEDVMPPMIIKRILKSSLAAYNPPFKRTDS